MTKPETHTLDVPGATLTYDVRQPEHPSGAPPLFVLASPMAAGDFTELADHLDDRVVITYDPRGTERSTLTGDVSFEIHGDDYHRVVEAAGVGPVDVFASSGGAVASLAWIVAQPDDLRTVVLHEPPLITVLEDRDVVRRLMNDIHETYLASGFGPAMAKFIASVMVQGPVTDDYLRQPAPDPTMFGLPAEDDGSRDDLLLGGNMAALPGFEPDMEGLRASTVRIVPAVGEASDGQIPARGAIGLAEALGLDVVAFPGDHGGFMRNEYSPDNDPAAFATRLREVLAGA
jgi:pimeloyl-ACP methyl ester carboxylesterase